MDRKTYRKIYNKNWRKNNKEKWRGLLKKWKKNNPEKVKEMFRNWRRANLEKVRETKRIWEKKNPEKVKRHRKKWKSKNQDKIKQERARRRGAKGLHMQTEWETLKAQYNWTCPACHRSEPEIKLTEDHIIPISKGGSNNIENIQPLCKGCNSRKYTKIIKYNLDFLTHS